MTGWNERIRDEINAGRKIDISTIKSAGVISKEADSILTQANAANLLHKTNNEIWRGQGGIINSIISADHNSSEKCGDRNNQGGFYPKYGSNGESKFVVGLRLQAKFLSISYKVSGENSGGGFPGEAKGGPAYEYSHISNEDYYTITAIHVFRRKFYESHDFRYVLKVWDGEFSNSTKETIGEALPNPGTFKNYYVRSSAELHQPEGAIDSRAEKEDITASNLENCLYQIAKNRVSLNGLPPQLALRKIKEIESASIWSHNKILSINHQST